MKLDRKDKIEIFENAISWIDLACLFMVAEKTLQFEGASAIKNSFRNDWNAIDVGILWLF
jgi:hypothetical protein